MSLVQDKERILEAPTKKKDQYIYIERDRSVRITTANLTETIKAKRAQTDAVQTLRQYRSPSRLLYTQEKSLQNQTKYKQHFSTYPALQKVLEGKLQNKEVNQIKDYTKNK